MCHPSSIPLGVITRTERPPCALGDSCLNLSVELGVPRALDSPAATHLWTFLVWLSASMSVTDKILD